VAVAAADEEEGGAVDAIVGVAVVVVGDSRPQRQNRLGCAAVRNRRVKVVGLPCGFVIPVLDMVRLCFWVEVRMWDTAL
jgi:hypothetical protein